MRFKQLFAFLLQTNRFLHFLVKKRGVVCTFMDFSPNLQFATSQAGLDNTFKLFTLVTVPIHHQVNKIGLIHQVSVQIHTKLVLSVL